VLAAHGCVIAERLVEALVLVIDCVRVQEARAAPGPHRGLGDAEDLRHLADGQHAGVAQAVVSALEAVGASDVLHDDGVKRPTLAGEVTALVEDASDLSLRVVVE
jgi:hypothetical protein